jgi:hypothetical protein
MSGVSLLKNLITRRYHTEGRWAVLACLGVVVHDATQQACVLTVYANELQALGNRAQAAVFVRSTHT